MEDKKKVIDITWQVRAANVKWAAKNAFDSVKNFVSENKAVVAAAVPIAGKIVYDLIKGARRKGDLREERRLKDTYIYDPRLGMYFECRKKLTPNERLEFAARRDKGESVGEILRSMKVLKR